MLVTESIMPSGLRPQRTRAHRRPEYACPQGLPRFVLLRIPNNDDWLANFPWFASSLGSLFPARDPLALYGPALGRAIRFVNNPCNRATHATKKEPQLTAQPQAATLISPLTPVLATTSLPGGHLDRPAALESRCVSEMLPGNRRPPLRQINRSGLPKSTKTKRIIISGNRSFAASLQVTQAPFPAQSL
jgi:hypothetical protein